MAAHSLFLIALACLVSAQTPALSTWAATPLVSLSFPKPTDAPQKVWPDVPAFERGPQTGYNICNSTTEGGNSLCQTAYVNDLSDFCLWGPTTPNSNISDTEGDEVAWCTKKGYGSRLIPQGALLGVQLLKNADYLMITGLIDQTKINIRDGDSGGELDSGSQDGRGNPIGGLMYSTNFDPSMHQVQWWTQFIGNGMFCMKICNPASSNQGGYCQHTLDRIGLEYNCPSKYTIGSFAPGEFEVCDSADMGVPGIYTDAVGAVQSYSQPPESLGDITNIPYSVTTASASSNCKQTPSAQLFTDAAAATPTGTGSGSATPNGSSGASGASGVPKTSAPVSTGSPTGSGAPTSMTGKNGAARASAGAGISVVLAAASFIILL